MAVLKPELFGAYTSSASFPGVIGRLVLKPTSFPGAFYNDLEMEHHFFCPMKNSKKLHEPFHFWIN